MVKIEIILVLIFMVFMVGIAITAQGAGMPRPEHPRPDLVREAWQNLNGEWFFMEDSYDQGEALSWFNMDELKQRIIVPYEFESPLSGIGRQNPSDVIWYMRKFELDDALQGKRVILHFGAVDYLARVWLNGEYLGEHRGGYTPFSFDVTEELEAGPNRLTVRVFDSKSVQQVRGKQTWKDKGFGIVYTATSGIWQTVWIEAVGPVYIERYQTFFDREKGEARFRVFSSRSEPGFFLSASIRDPGGRPVDGPDRVEIKSNVTELVWRVENPRLWSPEEPDLYDLKFQISDIEGNVIDEVSSYAGLRTIEVKDGEVLLNGEPIYQKLLLVQGYFTPKAVYSPESDDAFRKDVEDAKLMGFNGARVHQKIEDPRYYYWCDKLGFLIWEEMPSFIFWKINNIPKNSSRKQFQVEMQEMMERDFNHPSVIVWAVFNESWGVFNAPWSPSTRRFWLESVALARELDPTRLIVDNSGWLHRDTDILDVHHYLPTVEKSEEFYKALEHPRPGILPNFPALAKGALLIPPLFWGTKYKGQPVIISEYGGFGFYRAQDKSLLDNYREYTEAIGRYPYIKGYCYTQQYDIEQEANGIQNEDRSFKVAPEEIKKINDSIGKK